MSAKGAVSSPAWGNAPGFVKQRKKISAEGAIQITLEFSIPNESLVKTDPVLVQQLRYSS